MDIDVVIVNWNSGKQIRDCIASLRASIAAGQVRVIVVDNGSTDGSDQGLEQEGVSVLRTGANLGFARACNLGAAEGSSPFVLFLNPDAAVYPGTLDYVLGYMRDPHNAQVGVCGVQLEEESGHVARSCTRLPTTASFLAHAVGLDRIQPRLGFFMAEWAHDNDRTVDHVIGAFYLIRRELFDRLQGFDERFFVYLEDLDLSKRVKDQGYRIEFLTKVKAFHKGGGTSDQVKARRLFYSLRSRILYAFKHLGRASASAVLLATVVPEPILRVGLALLKRKGVGETLQAYRLLFGWLGEWLRTGKTR
ncbi:GT2 family glycosyltransferase [Pseudomonas hunanensis]|uniref:GT2 family glycosyltransferase n=1 Tax=Pseudomonas hunanensis TaxID=1247546 RepID=A0ACC6K6Q9_9PSED|nr:glycosyltransferase family 2 protein [Pseudomonas hunanensis]MDR6714139.1 GT2 family glycosyltransferase [Pseudomonas hunanensis]